MKRNPKTTIFLGALLGIAIAIAGYFLYCPSPNVGLYPPAPNTKIRTIYFIQHEWHSGLAWAQEGTEKFGAEAWQDSPYVEVGWGDQHADQRDAGTFTAGKDADLLEDIVAAEQEAA